MYNIHFLHFYNLYKCGLIKKVSTAIELYHELVKNIAPEISGTNKKGFNLLTLIIWGPEPSNPHYLRARKLFGPRVASELPVNSGAPVDIFDLNFINLSSYFSILI